MGQSSIELTVIEGYERDEKRNRIRIDSRSFKTINAVSGDVVELSGKKKTTAICLPLFPGYCDKGVIGMTNEIQNNAGVTNGEKITLKKSSPSKAEIVSIRPLVSHSHIDLAYLSDELKGVPFVKGDHLFITYFDQDLEFEIISAFPNLEPLLITEETIFHLIKI